MVNKYCFVPSCNKNSRNNPKKIFIRLPANLEVRKRWYEAVYPDMSKVDLTKTCMLFCCEDHFDMETDSENWMKYKLIGSKLLMKKDAVPHRNMKPNESPVKESQLSFSTKKRKEELIEAFRYRKKLFFEDTASTSSTPMSPLVLPETYAQISSPVLNECSKTSIASSCNTESGKVYISKGIQVKPQILSVKEQAKFGGK